MRKFLFVKENIEDKKELYEIWSVWQFKEKLDKYRYRHRTKGRENCKVGKTEQRKERKTLTRLIKMSVKLKQKRNTVELIIQMEHKQRDKGEEINAVKNKILIRYGHCN